MANLKIKLEDFVKIPDTKIAIAKRQSFNGLKWEEAHFKLQENGLFMPTPSLFTKYLTAVIQAKDGKTQLYDANGKDISYKETKKLYGNLTNQFVWKIDSIWTWLDAKFVKSLEGSELDIETDHRVIVNSSDKHLQCKVYPLESFLKEKCYTNLIFNSQGLPKKISPAQEYVKGENIFYYSPKEDCVVDFMVGARVFEKDTVVLDCANPPFKARGRFALLWKGRGVLACIETDNLPLEKKLEINFKKEHYRFIGKRICDKFQKRLNFGKGGRDYTFRTGYYYDNENGYELEVQILKEKEEVIRIKDYQSDGLNGDDKVTINEREYEFSGLLDKEKEFAQEAYKIAIKDVLDYFSEEAEKKKKLIEETLAPKNNIPEKPKRINEEVEIPTKRKEE